MPWPWPRNWQSTSNGDRQQYAIGGAIALGYWGTPRGTVDVNLTLYLPPERPAECLALLDDIGCRFSVAEARASLGEHGFCRVTFAGLRVNVFLPIAPFYEAAHLRRKRLELGNQQVMVWDAESLVVFKLMFFRRKDLADIEQVLRAQGEQFDRDWVREAARRHVRRPRPAAFGPGTTWCGKSRPDRRRLKNAARDKSQPEASDMPEQQQTTNEHPSQTSAYLTKFMVLCAAVALSS